jgi:hypothetical protein
LGARHPGNGGRVVAGGGDAGGDGTEVVDQDVVVFRTALFVRDEAFEDFGDFAHFHGEGRFLEDFAGDGIAEAFASFDAATGERPVTAEGIFAALDEEDGIAIKDERSDAEDGTAGVAAVIGRGGWLAGGTQYGM